MIGHLGGPHRAPASPPLLRPRRALVLVNACSRSGGRIACRRAGARGPRARGHGVLPRRLRFPRGARALDPPSRGGWHGGRGRDRRRGRHAERGGVAVWEGARIDDGCLDLYSSTSRGCDASPSGARPACGAAASVARRPRLLRRRARGADPASPAGQRRRLDRGHDAGALRPPTGCRAGVRARPRGQRGAARSGDRRPRRCGMTLGAPASAWVGAARSIGSTWQSPSPSPCRSAGTVAGGAILKGAGHGRGSGTANAATLWVTGTCRRGGGRPRPSARSLLCRGTFACSRLALHEPGRPASEGVSARSPRNRSWRTTARPPHGTSFSAFAAAEPCADRASASSSHPETFSSPRRRRGTAR